MLRPEYSLCSVQVTTGTVEAGASHVNIECYSSMSPCIHRMLRDLLDVDEAERGSHANAGEIPPSCTALHCHWEFDRRVVAWLPTPYSGPCDSLAAQCKLHARRCS